MCKVTVKGVEKFLKGASGEKDGKPWELHVFKCPVSVDGSKEEAVRTCKTFDFKIAESIKEIKTGKADALTFEAKKEGDAPPFDFLLVPERVASGGGKWPGGYRNRGGRNGSESFGPTNRQQALRMAYENAKLVAASSGDVAGIDEILRDAEKLLGWLDGGGD